MTTRMINTKNIASYGAALASIGLSSHAQAVIVDLTANLPKDPLKFGYYTSFDLLGKGGSNGFRQYNDTDGKTIFASLYFSSAASIPTTITVPAITATNYSNVLTTTDFVGGNQKKFLPNSDGTKFIGFMTEAGQVGWLKFNLGGIEGDITYLAAYLNDTPGETIHVGTDKTTAPNPGVPEPKNTALIGLGLLASGASGIRRLRRTAKSQRK